MNPPFTPQVRSVDLIVRYKLQANMRRNQFVFEDKLKEVFPSPAQQIPNRSDMPPDQPRLIFADGLKSLAVSDTLSQLSLQFTDGRTPPDWFGVVRKYAEILDRVIPELPESIVILFSGIVINVNYPISLSEQEISNILFEKIVKISKMGDPITCSINVGFLLVAEEIFVNYGLSIYKKLEFTTASVPLFLDVDQAQTNEIGIAIKLDLNNRPRVERPDLDRSLVGLLETLKGVLEGKFGSPLGEDFAAIGFKND